MGEGPSPLAGPALRAGVWLRVLLGCLLAGATTASAVAQGTNPPGAKSSRGFTYLHDEVRDVPLSIHVLKIERSCKDLQLDTTLGWGTNLGMSIVSEQMRRLPRSLGRPVAAINGDFYYTSWRYPGDPMGLQIAHGQLISAPAEDRACFWVDANDQLWLTNVQPRFHVTWPDGKTTPFGLNEERDSDMAVLYTAVVGPSTRTIGGSELVLERHGTNAWLPLRIGQTYTARVREVRAAANTSLSADTLVLSFGPRLAASLPKVQAGAVLQLSTATVPDLAGAKTGLGGGPTILRNGTAVGAREAFFSRNPRTAVGWSKDHFFMLVVDGRQGGLSVGMTLGELARYFLKLGCRDALNLDGGGSTTFWLLGNVVNSPSQGHQRPAANTLVLLQKEAAAH